MRAIAAAVLVALGGCATGPADTSPPLEVVSIHEAPGRTGPELCRAARDWAALNFKDSKSVIQVYDPEHGKLIGKGVVSMPAYTETWYYDFTMVVECKDGRVRAAFTDFMWKNEYGTFPLRNDSLFKAKDYTEAKIRALDASLGESLKKLAKSDW